MVISRSDGEDAKLHPACGVAFPFENSFLYNPVKIPVCLRPKSFHSTILSALAFPIQVIFQPKSISKSFLEKKIKKNPFFLQSKKGFLFLNLKSYEGSSSHVKSCHSHDVKSPSVFPSVFLLEFFS